MPNYTYLSDLTQQIPNTPVDSIVSQSLFKDEQMSAILFSFAPGESLSEHKTPQKAHLYFIQGEADITLGDDSLVAQAGTWVQMPPNLPHSVVAKTAVLMLLTMVKPGW